MVEIKHNNKPSSSDRNPDANVQERTSQDETVSYDHSQSENLADKLGDQHLNILPTKKLVTCMLFMAIGLFTAFVDQSAVTVGLATLAKDLNAEKSINWAGTSSLLANCVCQILFGRLSDIFGRKNILMGVLIILVIADLCCGFAQTGPQFYVFRAFAGIGTGGVQALNVIIISDIVTLQQRGKFQGILGAAVGLGNAVGPFLMAAFIKTSSWRNFYHMMPALVFIQVPITYFLIPGDKSSNHVLSRKDQFKNIDYWGMLFSTAALALLLIPINGGGSTYAWDSALVIVMFIIGGLCFIAFLFIEWKFPKLPMIPIQLFKTILLCLIFLSNFLFGMMYYSFLYYIPYYFQIVQGYDEIYSALLILPLVLTQACSSTIAGQIISRSGHYKYVLITGYGVWLLACGLLLLFDISTPRGTICGVMFAMGCGVGFIFQPSVVAAQAQSRKSDRAVVIGTRNVIRNFGGAVGTAISSLIVSNGLLKEISKAINSPDDYENIPTDYLSYLREHIFNKVQIQGLNKDQIEVVHQMYMSSLRNYFIMTIPLLGVCFITSFLVRDRGLRSIDEVSPQNTEEGKA